MNIDIKILMASIALLSCNFGNINAATFVDGQYDSSYDSDTYVKFKKITSNIETRLDNIKKAVKSLDHDLRIDFYMLIANIKDDLKELSISLQNRNQQDINNTNYRIYINISSTIDKMISYLDAFTRDQTKQSLVIQYCREVLNTIKNTDMSNIYETVFEILSDSEKIHDTIYGTLKRINNRLDIIEQCDKLPNIIILDINTIRNSLQALKLSKGDERETIDDVLKNIRNTIAHMKQSFVSNLNLRAVYNTYYKQIIKQIEQDLLEI